MERSGPCYENQYGPTIPGSQHPHHPQHAHFNHSIRRSLEIAEMIARELRDYERRFELFPNKE